MHLVVPPKLKSIVLSKKQLCEIFSNSYVLNFSQADESRKQFLTFGFLIFPVKRIL